MPKTTSLSSPVSMSNKREDEQDPSGEPVISSVCIDCQQRHLKCSGGPRCQRCVSEDRECVFKPTHRGRRRHVSSFAGHDLDGRESHKLSTTCIACRTRHLKCSGGTTCHRCVNEGIDCQFPPNRRGRRPHATHTKKRKLDPRQVPLAQAFERRPKPGNQGDSASPKAIVWLPPALITFPESTNLTALRSSRFFQDRTAPNLVSGDYDSAFWKVLVLQVAYTEPAIRHSIAALGSLHESLELAYSAPGVKGGRPLQIQALNNHQQAISLLRDRDKQLSDDIVLVSCVLFVSFLIIQRDFQSAVNVLRSGWKAMSQKPHLWKSSSGAKGSELALVLSRITRQLSHFLDTDSMVRRSPQAMSFPSFDLTYIYRMPSVDLASHFTSLQEAKDCLDDILDYLYSVVDPVFYTPNTQFAVEFSSRARTMLGKWHTMFYAIFCKNQLPQKDVLSLTLTHHMASIAALTFGNEVAFDSYNKQFESVISLSEAILEMEENDQSPNLASESRPTGVGVILALSLCAFRCRCPRLRRRAMNILQKQCWVEGHYHSRGAAFLAERVIAIEEKGLHQVNTCQDVPASHRIRVLTVDRPTGVASPSDYRGPFPYEPGIWSVPRAREYLQHVKGSGQILLHYVREPWNASSPIEEMKVDLPEKPSKSHLASCYACRWGTNLTMFRRNIKMKS